MFRDQACKCKKGQEFSSLAKTKNEGDLSALPVEEEEEGGRDSFKNVLLWPTQLLKAAQYEPLLGFLCLILGKSYCKNTFSRKFEGQEILFLFSPHSLLRFISSFGLR